MPLRSLHSTEYVKDECNFWGRALTLNGVECSGWHPNSALKGLTASIGGVKEDVYSRYWNEGGGMAACAKAHGQSSKFS